MAIYAKIRANGEYHSQNFAHAVYGFREMGAEIIKYKKIDEIYFLIKYIAILRNLKLII